MTTDYDLVVIGGGIAGSALAITMAEAGADVLVPEATEAYQDRVRGEWLAPWGVAEAKMLGIYDRFLEAGGHELRYISTNGAALNDLQQTSSCHQSSLSFYHPDVQKTLLHAAEHAGAHIRRDPDYLRVAGLLLGQVSAPDNAVFVWFDTWQMSERGVYLFLFPQGGRRARVYVSRLAEAGYLLSGKAAVPEFISLFVQAGAPEAYLTGSETLGPLVSYRGADTWVDHPYRNGVALIGDAAAATDPTHGQGLSLSLRDVRTLRDELLGETEWNDAGHAYAEAHDMYFQTIHTFEGWFKELWLSVGSEAAARRDKVLIAREAAPADIPDVIMNGPDIKLDQAARSRYFGGLHNNES